MSARLRVKKRERERERHNCYHPHRSCSEQLQNVHLLAYLLFSFSSISATPVILKSLTFLTFMFWSLKLMTS